MNNFSQYKLGDLELCFRKNAPLNQADVAIFYMGEEKGYNDYPKIG